MKYDEEEELFIQKIFLFSSSWIMNQQKQILIRKRWCSMEKKYKWIFSILLDKKTTLVCSRDSQIIDSSSILAIRDTYIRGGEGFLLVFDVTDAESFSDLNEL